ncbi:hypothetical protein MHBO_003801, partial [Bonamia ostreae]
MRRQCIITKSMLENSSRGIPELTQRPVDRSTQQEQRKIKATVNFMHEAENRSNLVE